MPPVSLLAVACPPEDARVPIEVFHETIDLIEERLGLQGQPRAVVFHEKEGRLCSWEILAPSSTAGLVQVDLSILANRRQ